MNQHELIAQPWDSFSSFYQWPSAPILSLRLLSHVFSPRLFAKLDQWSLALLICLLGQVFSILMLSKALSKIIASNSMLLLIHTLSKALSVIFDSNMLVTGVKFHYDLSFIYTTIFENMQFVVTTTCST